MAAGTMFKWLDLLEREFDRSFVTIDLLLGKFSLFVSKISENLTLEIQAKSTRNKVILPMKEEINWESFHLASGSL